MKIIILLFTLIIFSQSLFSYKILSTKQYIQLDKACKKIGIVAMLKATAKNINKMVIESGENGLLPLDYISNISSASYVHYKQNYLIINMFIDVHKFSKIAKKSEAEIFSLMKSDVWIKEFQSDNINYACSRPEQRVLLENNARIKLDYYSLNKKYLFTTETIKKDCIQSGTNKVKNITNLVETMVAKKESSSNKQVKAPVFDKQSFDDSFSGTSNPIINDARLKKNMEESLKQRIPAVPRGLGSEVAEEDKRMRKNNLSESLITAGREVIPGLREFMDDRPIFTTFAFDDDPTFDINSEEAMKLRKSVDVGYDEELSKSGSLEEMQNTVAQIQAAEADIANMTENKDDYIQLGFILIILIIAFILLKNMKKIANKSTELNTNYKVKAKEKRIKKIAEEEFIKQSIAKSIQESNNDELQELINKAIAKGDSETAQALLKVLEKK